MILADKIIALRKKNNWSQEELAEKLNVSRQAVSKWESAQSIPDITRILDMSKLLGVSVDYLIKDELEVETTASLTDETGRTTYTLTLEKAQEFLAFQRKAARAIALGVWLCVMAFMVMITAEDWPHDELMTYAFDVIVLLIISAAVALFIVFGLEFNKYKWISEEPFDTAYGVEGVVRKELKAFTPTFTSSIVTGVALCILSCICFAAIPIVPKYADLPAAVAIGAGLTMVACGVFLFVHAGIIKEGYSKLLQQGDYTHEKKRIEKRLQTFTSIYWLTVLVIFFIAGFLPGILTNQYKFVGPAVLLWPIAGVLYPLAHIILVFSSIRTRSDKGYTKNRAILKSTADKRRAKGFIVRHAQYTAESIELAIFLALSGGLMDAYSYLVRDQVFANAQTGNLLLLGVHVASGNFSYISHYAMPVIAFALGIAFIHFISLHWVSSRVSWHTIAVAIEIALLLGVGCIPAGQSLLANSLTSLACGIQVQAFRRLHGFPLSLIHI